jgi:hypothetical protein
MPPAQSSPTVPGVLPLSNESFVWVDNGPELMTTETRKLWSTSTQLSVSIASSLSNFSSMEHLPGKTYEPSAGGDLPPAVLPTDSQSTRVSISTTPTGETIRLSICTPPPPLPPASKQSTTNCSAATPIGGHGGSSHPNPVPQFHSTPAPPRSKLRLCRHCNSLQPPGIMCGSCATINASTSQRTTDPQSTSGSINCSTVVQPSSTAPPSPAHSCSDSGIGSSPPPTTSPNVAPGHEEIRQRWNNAVLALHARAEAFDPGYVRQQARCLINELLNHKRSVTPPQSSPVLPGVVPLSSELFVRDDQGLEQVSATGTSKLWSSSTQSSPFNASPVSFISSERSSGTGNEPGAIGDNVSSVRNPGSLPTTGGSVTPTNPSTPPLHLQLASEQSTNVCNTATTSGSNGGSSYSSARHERPQHFESESGRESNDKKWVDLAHATIARANALILPYEGKRLPTNVAAAVQQRAGKILDDLLDASEHVSSPLKEEVVQCVAQAATVTADLFFPEEGECVRHSRTTSPLKHPSHSSEFSATALLFSKTRISYLLERISDVNLIDVQSGGDIAVPLEQLRTLFEVQVPSVRDNIKECLNRTAEYAALPGADLVLINTAQTQCQNAEKWCDQVVCSYQSAQLHLDGNVASKKVTFKKFDPNGSVSIYEFLSDFDDYCSSYIPDTVKPRLLYTKYLHHSLTTGYVELEAVKHNYATLRAWLINRFGSVAAVADNRLRAIKALKTPKSTDDALIHARYVRDIHRSLLTLTNLEISKGVPVPQLREYVSSHSFLLRISEVLPASVKMDWIDALAEQGVMVHNIEGLHHLQQVLALLKKRYTFYELFAGMSPGEPVYDSVTATTYRIEGPVSHPTPSVISSCESCGSNRTYVAEVTQKGGKPENLNPHQHHRSSKPQKSISGSKPKSDSKPQTKYPLGICPMTRHRSHPLSKCRRFFGLDNKERQKRCKWSCITCLSPSGCSTKCQNLATVPKLLLCPECGSGTGGSGSKSINVLLCSNATHAKPSGQEITAALEGWIPNFDGTRLTRPIVMGHTHLTSSGANKPLKSRSSASDPSPAPIVYNTRSGSVKPLPKSNTVVKISDRETNPLQAHFTQIATAYSRSLHTSARHFPRSKSPCLEDRNCPNRDVRLRAQPSWCDSGLKPVTVGHRSECSKTLMPIGDLTRFDGPNDCAGRSIRLRPNPGWCDSGLAPIPAHRSGCFDTNSSQHMSPLFSDPVNFNNLSTKPISVKDLVSHSQPKGTLAKHDVHVSVKPKYRSPVRENPETPSSSLLSSAEKGAVITTPVNHRFVRTEVNTAYGVSTPVCSAVNLHATLVNAAFSLGASLPVLNPDVPPRFYVHRQTHAADSLQLCHRRHFNTTSALVAPPLRSQCASSCSTAPLPGVNGGKFISRAQHAHHSTGRKHSMPNRGNRLLFPNAAVAPLQAATTITDDLLRTFQHVMPAQQEEVLTHVSQVTPVTAGLFDLRTGDGNPPRTAVHADPSHADLFSSQSPSSSTTDVRSLPISISGTPVEQSTVALNTSTSYTARVKAFNPVLAEKISSHRDSSRTKALDCTAEPHLPSSRLHNTILRVPTFGRVLGEWDLERCLTLYVQHGWSTSV